MRSVGAASTYSRVRPGTRAPARRAAGVAADGCEGQKSRPVMRRSAPVDRGDRPLCWRPMPSAPVTIPKPERMPESMNLPSSGDPSAIPDESPIFQCALPEEVGVSSAKLERLGDAAKSDRQNSSSPLLLSSRSSWRNRDSCPRRSRVRREGATSAASGSSGTSAIQRWAASCSANRSRTSSETLSSSESQVRTCRGGAWVSGHRSFEIQFPASRSTASERPKLVPWCLPDRGHFFS